MPNQTSWQFRARAKVPGRQRTNGLPVYDALQDEAIRVKLEHIKGSCPRSMCECATSRAAKAMGFVDALVSPYRARLREPGRDYWLRFVIHWPERAIIRNYDNNGGFCEDIILLQAPTKHHRLGKRTPETKREKSPPKTRSKRRIISLRNWPSTDEKIQTVTKVMRQRIAKALDRQLDREHREP